MKNKRAALLLLCALAFSGSATAQAPTPSFEESLAKLQTDSADSRRAHAEKMKKQAAELRELEASARAYAAQAKDVQNREMWEKDAAQRAALAQKLEEDAAKELGLAGGEEGKAQELQTQAAEKQAAETQKAEELAKKTAEIVARDAAQATDNEVNHMPLEMVIGTWEITGTPEALTIVQEDPASKAYQYKLEAHTTKKRVWKGDYTSFNKEDSRRAQKGRIVLRYTPEADEMNPEIPEWAREQIEGKLEWEVELDEDGTCGTPGLTGRFYPGEVTWEDREDGLVEIKGRGEPHTLTLEKSTEYNFDIVQHPALYVKLTPMHDPLVDPIMALLKGQMFYITVQLPYEQAKKEGDTIDVTIKGLANGKKDTLELKAGAMIKGKTVSYTSGQPYTIDNKHSYANKDRDVPFLSWSWIKELLLPASWYTADRGPRLLMEVENGEVAEFRFGDAYESIPIYDSWVQRDAVKLYQEAAQARDIYQSLIDTPKYPEEVKTSARRILQMLDNMQKLLDSGLLTDLYKTAVLEQYLTKGAGNGLIYHTPQELDELYRMGRNEQNDSGGRLLDKPAQSFTEGLTGEEGLSKKLPALYKSIQWTSPGEEILVGRAIQDARQLLDRQLSSEMAQTTAFGTYDTTMIFSVADDVRIVATGLDSYGKKRPWHERALTAVGLTSSYIVFRGGTMTAANFSERMERWLHARPGDPGPRLYGDRHRTGRAWRKQEKFTPKEDMPDFPENKLTREQRRQAGLEDGAPDPDLKEAGSYLNEGTLPSSAFDAKRVKSLDGNFSEADLVDGGIDLYDSRKMTQDMAEADATYGSSYKFVDKWDDRKYRRQDNSDCNLNGFLNVMEEEGEPRMSAWGAFSAGLKAGIFKLPKKLTAALHPMNFGFWNKDVRAFASLHDYDSFELPKHRNPFVSLEDISRIQDKMKYKAVVHLDVGDMKKIRAARFKAMDNNFDYDISRLSQAEVPGGHAVRIHEFVRDGNGKITAVQFKDSGFGRIVELPACEFSERMRKWTETESNVIFYKKK